MDTNLLIRVAGGRVACTVFARLLSHCQSRVQIPLNKRIKQYYSIHIFHSMARLDVPTFDDPAVQRQMESAWSSTGRSSVCWETVQMAAGVMSTLIKLLSQVSVLIAVLHDQRDGALLTLLSFGESIFQWTSARRRFTDTGGKRLPPLPDQSLIFSSVWAATSNNEDYLRMEGMKRVIDDPIHRKEMVVGNMSKTLTARK